MSVGSHLNDDEQLDEEILDSNNMKDTSSYGSSWYDSDGTNKYNDESKKSTRWVNKRNRYYYYGNGFNKDVSSKKRAWKSLCIFVLSVAITICAICTIFDIKNVYKATNKLSEYVDKYEHYQELCAQAYGNPDYLTTAIVTDAYFNINANKYYVKYEINYDGSYFLYKYTDPVYTYSEAMALVNQTINVALDCNNLVITSSTEAITMDYYTMDKMRDGVYSTTLALRDSYIKKAIIAVSVGCIFLIVLLVVIIKRKKKLNKVEDMEPQKDSKQAEQELTEVKSDLNLEVNLDFGDSSVDITTEEYPKTAKWFCEFCETYNKDELDKCESCGARRPINK